MTKKPFLAPFSGSKPLILEPMPNGGWVVSQQERDYGRQPAGLGAFSSTGDMLDALECLRVRDVQDGETT
ncbi:hypothetical protein SAMN05216376_111130 [Mameliella alba]|uniref:hypothetical protein n=1 Tax=Mameliella alba TaxID=561184 RepID=UPI00088CAEB5|nr:hypothetical protein [Mameliella alba]OWV46483.1 hypothetical protein CDZ96_17890 [Mameliella alba]PTR37294.1 hypothetical protein LX94_03633 [Mameliella alba]GGF73601.1 hypothetical protein GCM10011319_37650 [Mameliella alba]SDD76584.1 hypothetical protein SAMN05216376_111130 [Mameliella alba]